MSKNIEQLPYTEIVERTREIARITSDNDRPRARGAVNDLYVRKIPAEEDWTFLLVSSSLTCTAPYITGNLTINTQDSALTGGGGIVLNTSMVGFRIKFNENPDVYTLVSVTNTTTGTIAPILSGDRNIANGAFSIFQPNYALAPDFDRFPKNGGLLFYQGGQITQIPEVRETPYYRDYTPSPTSTPKSCRLVQAGTEGVQYVEVQPPPQKAYNFGYEYLKRPVVMRETTGGFCTISAGATLVTFQSAARVGEMTTGMFFRINAFGTGADSEWYRLIALSAANSTGTLQVAFAVSAAISAGYTVCHAPDFPVKLHPAIMHGAITVLTADQNDPLFQFYEGKYRETIDDAKRTFKTRIYKQEVETIFEDWNYRR